MNRACWLTYLDGTMPAEERAALDAAMEKDPGLRADLAAYQACCGSIRCCCQNEAIPMERLRAACFTPAAKPTRTWGPKLAYVGVACALAIGAFLMTRPGPVASSVTDPFLFAKGPVLTSQVVSSPAEAADYVFQQTNFDAPVLKFASVGKVDCGKEWASMEVTMSGEKIRIYMRPGLDCDFVKNKEVKLPCGTVVYCCEGTGWQTKGYSFYAVGGSEKNRMQLASLTQSSLADWSPRLN